MEEPSVRLIWRDWLVACCLASVAGLGAGTVAGVGLLVLFNGGWFGIVTSTVAFALVCGLVLGVLQHRTLVELLPYLHRGEWIGWTVFGASLVWAALVGASIIEQGMPRIGYWPSETGSLVLGGGMGVVVGAAQWMHLKEWVQRPWRWILLNTVAWGLATPLLWLVSIEVGAMNLARGFPLGAGLLLAAGLVVGVLQGLFVPRFDPKDEVAVQYTRSALDDIGSIDLSE